MGELKRIVVDDVPVEELPAILRHRIEGRPSGVRVTLEFEAGDRSAEQPRSLRSFIGAGRGLFETPEQATASIRELRDEWDD